VTPLPTVPPVTPTAKEATKPGPKKPEAKPGEAKKPDAKPDEAKKPEAKEETPKEGAQPASEGAESKTSEETKPAAEDKGFQSPEEPSVSLRLVGVILGRPRMAILRSEEKRYYAQERDVIQDQYYVERIEPQQVRLRMGAHCIILTVGGS
jgi:hypothetical protein